MYITQGVSEICLMNFIVDYAVKSKYTSLENRASYASMLN
jgi:hypothetical protein